MTKDNQELLLKLANLDPEKLERLLELADQLENRKSKTETVRGRTSKNPTTAQSINRNRRPEDNEFLKMKFSRQEQAQFKRDRQLDKILGKDWERVQPERESELVEVKCRVCGAEEIVHIDLVPPEQSRYKCNRCTK